MQDFVHAVIEQYGRTLGRVEVWAAKAREHAAARGFEADLFVAARLSPDQYPLGHQIGAACDLAKFAAARLSGKPAPSHPDDQKTWAEVLARRDDVFAFLRGFSAQDFAGAADQRVGLRWAPGKVLAGRDYLVRYSIPNFYFHATTAYAILRENGVDVGKDDFLGDLPFVDG